MSKRYRIVVGVDGDKYTDSMWKAMADAGFTLMWLAQKGFTDDCVMALALANWGCTRGRQSVGIYV